MNPGSEQRSEVHAPAANPCGSCPYRCDVPSGVWHEEEYDQLEHYDCETGSQSRGLFLCHQQNGRLCAGWVGCHDMDHSLAVRLAAMTGELSGETLDAVLDYETPVALFASGAEAAAHGRENIDAPDDRAERQIADLLQKRARRRARQPEREEEVH
jgi:hypothetical protein